MNEIAAVRSTPSPHYEEALLDPIDTKILEIWNRFFSEFQNIPSCTFIQEQWEIHKDVTNLSPTERVASLYSSMTLLAFPPRQREQQTLPANRLKEFMNLHMDGKEEERTHLIEFILNKIYGLDNSSNQRVFKQIQVLKKIEKENPNKKLSSAAEKAYKALLDPNHSEVKPHLIPLFFLLLERCFSDQIQQVEQIIKDILHDELLLESSKDQFIQDSVSLYTLSSQISSILVYVDQMVGEQARYDSLTKIKQRLEQEKLLPHYEGPLEEWLGNLREINKLSHIKTLNLSNLELTYLPPEITSLSFTGLTQIDLSNNLLRSLPSPFFRWSKKVTSLNLSYNKLSKVPSLDHWPHMRYFYASDNKIAEIAPDFGATWTDCQLVDLDDNDFALRRETYYEVKAILQKNLPKVKHQITSIDYHPFRDSE